MDTNLNRYNIIYVPIYLKGLIWEILMLNYYYFCLITYLFGKEINIIILT